MNWNGGTPRKSQNRSNRHLSNPAVPTPTTATPALVGDPGREHGARTGHPTGRSGTQEPKRERLVYASAPFATGSPDKRRGCGRWGGTVGFEGGCNSVFAFAFLRHGQNHHEPLKFPKQNNPTGVREKKKKKQGHQR